MNEILIILSYNIINIINFIILYFNKFKRAVSLHKD